MSDRGKECLERRPEVLSAVPLGGYMIWVVELEVSEIRIACESEI